MARLNIALDSGDELPDLTELLRKTKIESKSSPQKRCDGATPPASPLKFAAQNRRQRPLKTTNANPLLLPLTVGKLNRSGDVSYDNDVRDDGAKSLYELLSLGKERQAKRNGKEGGRLRSSPRKISKAPLETTAFTSVQEDEVGLNNWDSSEDHLSDFVVDDSDSDLGLPPACSPIKTPRRLHRKNTLPQREAQSKESSSIIDLTSPEKHTAGYGRPHTPQRDPSEELPNEDLKHLRFSPPRSRTPYKHEPDNRPCTPPSSPPKSKLRSPTKPLHRIPPSPHRPSIDAFWSQEVINNWNDQYSPQKLKSPRKLFPLREDDEADRSPTKSPQKSPSKSPIKRDKACIEKRKAFDASKRALANCFLQEVDEKVTSGRISFLASSTGGIKLIWSKTLNSTAGRANWKREAIRTENVTDPSKTTTEYRHYTSIELAEKVIDDEDRLRNVLAHEYCHLCNFMISNIKTNPHGKEFKAWAAKTTSLFAHVGIKVTTTHSYAISYKYIWQCEREGCGMDFKRHSRSIDPNRHSCGLCKGRLVQVQPAPRGKKVVGEEGKGMSDYQRFVKGNFGRVKGENPWAGVGEVMKRLGEEFRRTKAEREGSVQEAVVVDKEDEVGADDVVKKLDFLNLGP